MYNYNTLLPKHEIYVANCIIFETLELANIWLWVIIATGQNIMTLCYTSVSNTKSSINTKINSEKVHLHTSVLIMAIKIKLNVGLHNVMLGLNYMTS